MCTSSLTRDLSAGRSSARVTSPLPGHQTPAETERLPQAGRQEGAEWSSSLQTSVIRQMEAFSGGPEESSEDTSGRKKSKFKALKTRLFGKTKRPSEDESTKLSQSASDITAGKRLGSDEDLTCPQGALGSRALSHDSIFLAEQLEAAAAPARVLSQENVHSNIKALQMKLQGQKMHLGPPPMVLPIRRPDDVCSQSEDSGPHSPPDAPGGDVSPPGALIKMTSRSAARPLSPTSRPAPPKPQSPTPSGPSPLSLPLSTSPPSASVEAPLDFATPAQFTPCLDSSAARHRMSVKPKNQRASTKKKAALATFPSDTINDTEPFESVEEEEQQQISEKEEEEAEEEGEKEAEEEGEKEEEKEEEGAVEKKPEELDRPISCPGFASKSAEAAPVPTGAATKASRQDLVPPGSGPPAAPQVLRVKPQRRVDGLLGERPHSSYIESELKEKRDGDVEVQVTAPDKRNTINRPGAAEALNQLPRPVGSTVGGKSSSAHQHSQGEAESTRGIQRPAPGSGSLRFLINTAKNREEPRPQSGSFVEVLEQTEARQKTTKEAEERAAAREKEEPKGSPLRGGPFHVGRVRPDAGPSKTSVAPWEKRDSLKKVASKTAAVVTSEAEQAKSSQDEMEVAEEAKEGEAEEGEEGEEGKTAFGIKLRSTSQAVRLRSDSCSKAPSKAPRSDEQPDTQRRADASKAAANKQPANISSATWSSKDVRAADPHPSGLCSPGVHHTPSSDGPHLASAEVQTTSWTTEAERPQEPQPAWSEVSWMSLAMEKTSRSLQQLFTSRFPRDLTGSQTAARSQASEAATATQMQAQAGKVHQSAAQLQAASQPSSDAGRAEAAQSRSQTQTGRPSPVGLQRKTSVASPALSHTSREPQMSKQPSEDQSQSNTTQCASHPAVQTSLWSAQPPLRSSLQTEAAAQGSATQSLAQSYLSSGPQPAPRSKGGLQAASQLRATSAAPTSASAAASSVAPPAAPAVERGEKEATGPKEGPSLCTRRTVWSGSITEKAAFLERRAERAELKTLPGPNGVELRKAKTDLQTSAESPPAVAKIPPPNKDTVQDGREGVKPAESSPAKVSEKFREDKWLRKNVAQTSSASSSPTMPSVLQSMSGSGQPSWMELAKRKSMAWSDKTMD